MQNKVVIITGSSMGIGKNIALQLGQKGAKIVLNGRNKERLAKTHQELKAKGFEVIAIPGDVANYEDCTQLIAGTIEHFGSIDVLINNAGLAAEGTIESTEPQIFRKIMEVNYLGSIFPTKVALPHLKASKGSVLFISSLAGIHGLPAFSLYSASKMSLTAVAESLKKEMIGTGIHVGIAYVGFTQNDPNKTIYQEDGKLAVLPKRSNVKVAPVDQIAARLIGIIERRQFKTVFSPIGKLLFYLNRLSPGLVDFILTRSYKKRLGR